jgi:hypothetical protein
MDVGSTGAAQQDVAWSGGERLEASSAGDPASVPAFDVTVTAPSPFTPNEVPQSVARSNGLTVTWEGGSIGTLSFTLSQDVPAEPTYQSVSCTSAVGFGMIEISPTALGLFSPGSVSWSFENRNVTPFTAGGFDAQFDAVWGSSTTATAGTIALE